MLIACTSCHRQYDVGDQEPGARVRCFCGNLNVVPRRSPRQVPMQHCSNCGGAISGDGKDCEYCDAKIALGDRGWGESCPECMARMVKGAKFCGACGIRIEVQAALRPLTNRACPRCQETLELCEGKEEAFAECTACGGIWLTEAIFQRMLEKRQRLAVADALPEGAATSSQTPPPIKQHPVQYVPCPECMELMNRKNFASASGIMIDYCRGHGYWFDLHELEHIQQYVLDGGLERARAKRIQREKQVMDADARKRAFKRIRSSKSPHTSLAMGSSRWSLGGILFEAIFDILTSAFD